MHASWLPGGCRNRNRNRNSRRTINSTINSPNQAPSSYTVRPATLLPRTYQPASNFARHLSPPPQTRQVTQVIPLVTEVQSGS